MCGAKAVVAERACYFEHVSRTPGPGRPNARPLFLALSAVAFLALVLVGHAVMLPFLLAVVVAYVLFPLVQRVERLRVPRWIAILLVYAATIGSIVGFGWAVVPRLFDEVKALVADLPALTAQARDHYLPALDRKLGALTGGAARVTPAAPEAPAPPKAPIVVSPRGDGSFEVRLEESLELREGRDGHWVLAPPTPPGPRTFSSERMLRDALDRAVTHLQSNSLVIVELGRSIVGGISRGIFFFFLTLMLAAYLMLTFERIRAFVRELCPPLRRASFDSFLARVGTGMSGVVRGQLIICLVNGVLTAVGLWALEVKYWPVLSLVACVMSLVPIFGSILSTIPAVAIALTQSFGTAVGTLAWIVGIHQLEANFLNPKIIGDHAKIHPVLVVFALLLGEHFFAIPGALLAVPTLALAQAVFMHFRESILANDPPDAAPPSESSARTPTAESSSETSGAPSSDASSDASADAPGIAAASKPASAVA